MKPNPSEASLSVETAAKGEVRIQTTQDRNLQKEQNDRRDIDTNMAESSTAVNVARGEGKLNVNLHDEQNNSEDRQSKRRKKIITIGDFTKIGSSLIYVLSIKTDLNEAESTSGPWEYNNANSCIVKFTMEDSDITYSMRLDHLLERGPPYRKTTSLVFRWYSWIRFKIFSKLKSIPIASALCNEDKFISLLHDVNQYYTKQVNECKQEGLEPNHGPQTFADSSNLQLLHYYGKGTTKYYRKTTLLQAIAKKYGEAVKAEYMVEPSTPMIDATDYEEMLIDVNRILYKGYYRHLRKLKEYAGPQCHEDRLDQDKINYDVKFTSLSSKVKSDQEEPKCSIPKEEQSIQNEDPEKDLTEFFLRRCHDCNKIRWIGQRAASKFVLGKYSYGETDKHVRFSCSLLYNTSCDEEEDIISLSTFEPCPQVWVAYNNQELEKLPPVAFVMKTLRFATIGVDEVEIIAQYGCSNNKMSKSNLKAVSVRCITMARVELGQRLTTGRFQRFAEIPPLLKGRLNRKTPREALVCQSWLDHSENSSEDPTALYMVTNLMGIRDLHSTYDAMKIVHCSQCGMSSPGFEADVDKCINVPEAGKDIPLSNNLLLGALKHSKVLSHSSVKLDPAFSRATVLAESTVTGICTNCSKYCTITEEGEVLLLHQESSAYSQDTANSQQPVDDNISNINPYSIGNLMALDVFDDEASHQYGLFMDSLSQAEKLVLSPIHAVIIILRSRTNNVPFSRYGSISFAIKEPVKAISLPWHTFEKLPFVVMVSKHEDGSVDEAKVNMAKIIHAKELMEREVVCPVYGTKRPFYRFCDKVHTPFTATSMETLASQLCDKHIAVLPNGLRKLNVDKIHERASKRLTFCLFSEWLNSGFTIGSGIKDAFLIENQDCPKSHVENEDIPQKVWHVLKTVQSQTKAEKENRDISDEPIQITLTDVVRFCVQKGWLHASNEIRAASQKTVEEVLLPEDELNNITYLCCEEIELLLRESSNDEGVADSVAQGGITDVQTEDPQEILRLGMENTVLQRIQAPQVDRKHPVSEDSPGYLQMAFPDIFLTGDGCPHQERPRSIRNSSESYKFAYFSWVSNQPRALVSTEFQFLIHSMIKRQHSRGKAKLALKRDTFDQHGIPIKEDLMQNAQLRDWTVSNLMMFKSSVPDTTPFWKRSRDDAVAVQRDWEECVPWREEKTPLSVMLFQTRAPPYNHHPAIHHLCPDAKSLFSRSDEEFLEGRRRNVLRYPSIISFVCALMAELDTMFLAKLRYLGDGYFTRFEWGANANPHSHRLYFSQKCSDFLECLKHRIDDCFQNSKEEAINTNQDLRDSLVQEAIQTQVLDCWDHARKEYIDYIRPFYTNWNAGLLAEGEKKTFDFAYERKSTICRLNMAEVIDDALTSGQFSKLDTIYVSVVNGTCRHIGHTGINDQPAKTDRCAVTKKKRVKSSEPGKKQYKEVVTCKRRKPQPVSKKPTIEPDPYNKKLFQLQFESNDRWFNGHDPFEILHILSNADDKAVVPEFLRKPPELKITDEGEDNDTADLNLQYFSDIGDSATEYVTKYAFKDVVPTKTSAEVLITAMERLQDGDPINQGTVQKMYNAHAITGTTSIFQATHLNQQLPHVLSNVNIKYCSVSGLSLLRNDYSADDGEDYITPPLIKQFDGRHDTTVVCMERGKHLPELKAEIHRDMCLHQFCDLYDVKEIKHDGKRILHFKRRSTAREGRLNALKLIPCHGLKIANPRHKLHWNYCRTLCLWKIPCHKTTDFSPVGNDEEALKRSWIDLFNSTFVDGDGLPPWAYKFWKHYNLPRDTSYDTSSDEDDEEIEHARLTDTKEMPNVTDDPQSVDNNDDDDDFIAGPKTCAGKEKFYQNPIDRMRSAPQATQEINDECNNADSSSQDPDHLANPEGVDFMRSWLGDRIIPTTSDIQAQVAGLRNSEGMLSSDSFDSSTLNEKQRMAHDLVVEYVRCRLAWDENEQQGPPPKPLRLVVMGNPGTGKSWTLKCIMSTLVSMIGNNTDLDGTESPAWTDKIKLAAPTGAASSQMIFKAETLHRLFSIPIHLNEKSLHLEENSAGFTRLMLNFDPKKFLLLIIDEFSMLSRQMFAIVTERLNQCNINLNNIGIVVLGDPAQILPIAADPLWSARLHNEQGKDCSPVALMGMIRFREMFNLPLLQTIPNYEKWKNLTVTKDRLLCKEITAYRKSLVQGNFDAVFLTEVKRTENDDISQHFTGKILVNLRYGGKVREKEMSFLRKHCATRTEVNSSEEWKSAHVIHGYHFHSKDHANRSSVEADNAKALLRHHEMTGNPIMRIDSIHRPAENEYKLKAISAKEFEGAPPQWHACRGMRVMLLRNIAPSIGLYNGSIHTLIGPIYSNDSVEVSLTPEHLKLAELKDCTTTMPIETSGKEKQIPPKSVLLSVDGEPYEKSKFEQLPPKVQMKCRFQLPMNPPTMPDFMVIQASNYTGPNILKLPGCENFVPIAPVESQKEEKSRSRTNATQIKSKSKLPQTRIALPLEGGDAATSFKGQGANFHRAEVDLDGWFNVPGIFLVAISRVRSPSHLHIRTFPNYMDLKLQRMKENVLDAQTFEEAVRVKSECLYRHQENCGDEFWNSQTNLVADKIIEAAVSQGLSIKKDSLELVENIQVSDTNTDKDTILKVIEKLIQTKEYLVAEAAPNVSADDYETMRNYQKRKLVQTKPMPGEKENEVALKQTTSGRKRNNANKKQIGQHNCHLDTPLREQNENRVKVNQNKSEKVENKAKLQLHTCPADVLIPENNFMALKPRPDISRDTFKGLQNSGNNVCFINAAIIALCHNECFDAFLRGFHNMHQHCTGHLFDNNEPCPLCALYEIMNRAYRHHRILARDIPKMPIVKLTESLIAGWHIRMEHDADEFLTNLLQRLHIRLECNIHIGTVKSTRTCQICHSPRIRERVQPVRITLHLAEFEEEGVSVQDAINRWVSSEQICTCPNCGKTMHDINREIVNPSSMLIMNIQRSGSKKSLIDDKITIHNHVYEFRASINYHPHHYTTVAKVQKNRYIFYSDEEVQTCHGSMREQQRYEQMNRVRTPLEQLSTIFLFELDS